MELDSEVHSHPHKVGHAWVDILLASSALVLSIASIVISLQNESNMRRLVTANSWPYIRAYHGNETENGEAVVHFNVRNTGVGPATIEKLVMSYDGQPVRSAIELIHRCCDAAGGLDAFRRVVLDMAANQVMAPHEDIAFLAVHKSDADPAAWDRLNTERSKIAMSVCYSSVFGERWITSLAKPRPVSVTTCDELPGPGYDDASVTNPGP